MTGFQVGIIGGPGDGQLVAVPSRPGELGPPSLWHIVELHMLPDRTTKAVVVPYGLRVNEGDEGPLWFYVRPADSPEPPRPPWQDQDPPVAVAAQRVLSEDGHLCSVYCQCPLHNTQLLYSAAERTHACQKPTCYFAHGMKTRVPDLAWPRRNGKQAVRQLAEENFSKIRYRSTLEVTNHTALIQALREICPDMLAVLYPERG